MVEIERITAGLRATTVFFGHDTDRLTGNADVIACIQFASPTPGFEPVRTLHLDLTRETTALFSGCTKSTKNQLNRATKHDRFATHIIAQPTEPDILAFRDFYNAFARAKGTTLCRRYHLDTLKLLKRDGRLVITHVTDPEGDILCYHAYVADGARAMLLYSASGFRSVECRVEKNRMARANRYLHWQDILHFALEGFRIYDWGGLTDDAGIAEFKRSFGGDEVTEYTGYVPMTRKGRFAALLRKVLTRVRHNFFSPQASTKARMAALVRATLGRATPRVMRAEALPRRSRDARVAPRKAD